MRGISLPCRWITLMSCNWRQWWPSTTLPATVSKPRWPSKRQILERALELFRTEHERVLSARIDLARTLLSLGKVAESLSGLREVLEAVVRALPDVGSTNAAISPQWRK